MEEKSKENREIKFWNWIGRNQKQLIVILTLGIFISASVIGYSQYKGNQRALDLESNSGIFGRPEYNVVNGSLTNIQILVENTGLHPIYLEKYILDGNSIEIEGIIPPHRSWFEIPILPLNANFKLEVFYEDIDKKHYSNNISGKISEDGVLWVTTSRKSEINQTNP